MLRLKTGLSIRQIIYWLILIDLIWGGAGRVITIGPISLRILLLGFATAYGFIYMDSFLKGNCDSNLTFHWLLLLFYFILIFLYGLLLGNNVSFAIDEFTGNATILIIPFFMNCYQIDQELGRRTIDVFFKLVILFAFFQIGLWTYAYVTGEGNYMTIKRALDANVYGMISYIGTTPRVFLKSSIFLTGGLLITFKKLLCEKVTLGSLFLFALFTASILSTFTVAFFYLSAITALVYCLYLQKEGNFKSLFIMFVVIAMTLIIVFGTSALEILESRFSGDYTFEYKKLQALQALNNWSKQPIFGSGFGATINFEYGYTSENDVYHLEVMWLQLLFHTGIVGFSIFISYIFRVLKKCTIEAKLYDQPYLFACGLFIIFVCFVSFSNPFMNNTIGLIPFSMLAGYVSVAKSSRGLLNV